MGGLVDFEKQQTPADKGGIAGVFLAVAPDPHQTSIDQGQRYSLGPAAQALPRWDAKGQR